MRAKPVAMPTRFYAILFVPESGLFFDGKDFHDGTHQKIPFTGQLIILDSRTKANTRKKKLAEFYNRPLSCFAVVCFSSIEGAR